MTTIMNVDKCLSDLGGFGRYQLVIIVLFGVLASCLPAWQVFSFIFILYEPPHYCKTELEPNISIPIAGDGKYEKCSMFRNSNGSDEFSDETMPCTDGWLYDVADGEISLVTELDLVCDQTILSTTAVSIYFCGILAGSFITGQLSDLIGRKKTAGLTILVGAIAGTVLVVTKGYIAFVVVWFVLAMCEMSVVTTLFILYAELFPPKERTLALCINTIAWGLGFCLLTPIAYLFPNWRHFQLAITLPFLLFVPFWWFVVESPRWLLSKNRYKEVEQVFKKIAKFNGKYDRFVTWKISDDDKTDITLKDVGIMDSSNGENEAKEMEVKRSPRKVYTILDTVRTPQIRKHTIVLFYLWCVNSMVYYGLALNSSNVAGNRYINSFLLGLAEVPAYIFTAFAMPRYGRRKLGLIFHILAAVALFLILVVPEETDDGKNLTSIITTLAFLGKFGITTSYTVVWIFASEIFPTVVRNIGFSACSMSARIGGIVAPYVMYLGKYVSWIPLSIFTVLSLTAGFMMLLLPEALNRPLPETIEDGENFRNVIPLTNTEYQKAKSEDELPNESYTNA
ncbi:organic cation transporter protein-like [Anneissia japonica]|uniref:organic cation transporter protein-like n=1 Tax=Anneissia japonica TaxID=1529436 RepID=UPI001425918F|nr:organic cation transporter protein-like [Anneissia japonica]